MGSGYKRDWVPHEFTGIYHNVCSNNFLPYNERRDIYLSSTFALAFQSHENIKHGHLSQRIFEGLAYGCVVLCENKLASEFTNGIVVYISSKLDLLEKMKFYKNNPELMEEKINSGYEWVKKLGTNRYSAQFFLEKIKELYNYEL
jgi:spore maturation protein CgeB